MTRALILHPHLKRAAPNGRAPAAHLEEAVRLAEAIALDVIEARLCPLADYRPATLLGQGKIEELGQCIEEKEIALVICDHALTPVQQRNLEKAWKCKVIDRTALILEIFGERARTHEGKLQVELAALEYQKSRLVRSWTHLERQRGGFGFLGGPGESQIEIDRRLIRDRIAKIRAQLGQVARTRDLQRAPRKDAPYPSVALVGYTNAGKSTLFNRLTGAGVKAEDALFATLDPTLRHLRLPSGLVIVLSDTVGFVSDLPHELVAAFRATLEEVTQADILLHVRDIAHPDSDAQAEDVMRVLRSFLPEETLAARLVEVWNKADLLPETGSGPGIFVSAATGFGIEAVLAKLDARLRDAFLESFEIELPLEDGETLAWLYRHGNITSKGEENGVLRLTAEMTRPQAARWRGRMQAFLQT